MTTRLFLLLTFVFTAAVAAEPLSAPFPHEKSAIPVDPAVRWAAYDNGFRAAFLANQQPKDKVTLRLFVDAGSLFEDDDQRGLAHFLEHLAFKGSTRFPPGTLITTLQGLGLAFGAHTNAHTSFNETVYKLDLPDAKAETLAVGLRVMADWAGGLLIRPEDVESERGVILAEMRDRNTPDFRVWQASSQATFAGTRIPERITIGLERTVQAATAARLRDFYELWYRPERMVLSVVGAIDPTAAETAVRAEFATLAPKRAALPAPDLGTPEPGGDEVVMWHREAEAEDTNASVDEVQRAPRKTDSVEVRRVALLRQLGAQVVSRRLSDYAEAHPTGALISGEAYAYEWLELTIVGVNARARTGQSAAALELVATQRRSLMQFGPSAAELATAVAAMQSDLDTAVAQAGSRTNSGLADALYSTVRDGRVFQTPEQRRALLLPLLRAATPESVRDAWENGGGSIYTEHVAATVTGRDDLGAHGQADLDEAYKRAGHAELTPPATVAVAPWAYGNVPPTATVVSNNEAALGVRRVAFANHVQASLKQTDFQPGQVLLQVRLRLRGANGKELSADGKVAPRLPGLSDLINRALRSGGLGKHTARELRELFAASSIQLSGPDFSDDAALFTASCTPAELPRAAELIRAFIVDPAWRSEAEAQAKSAWLEELASVVTDVEAQVERRFTALIVGNDPARRPVQIDEAKSTDFAAAIRWFRPILTHAPLSVTVVGDIDRDAAQAAVARAFGGLGERWPLPAFTTATLAAAALPPTAAWPIQQARIDVPGVAAKAEVRVAWPTNDGYDVARNRRLGLLAQAFGERLRVRLREQLGQAYSPYAFRSASDAFRGFGFIAAVAGVPPERADDARATILAIAADLHDHGIDDALLAQVKTPTVKGLAARRQRNDYWLSSVLERLPEQPFRLDWAAAMEADYAAITAAELSVLAAQYFDNDKALTVTGVCVGTPASVPRKD